MKKILIPVLLLMIVASSCLPVAAPVDNAPQVDTQATIDSIVKTSAAQTLAAQPSSTTVPPTATGTAVVVLDPTNTTEVTITPSLSPEPNLTTTPVTATSGPEITSTSTLASSGGMTLTPTLGILKYGTLPPAVQSAEITLVNKSKRQVYISLQNHPPNRPVAILEYPVEKQVKVEAPLGYYLYVVWVGGRKIVGEFVLHPNDDLTISIFKDKVIIQ